jgi:hypothetical protein
MQERQAAYGKSPWSVGSGDSQSGETQGGATARKCIAVRSEKLLFAHRRKEKITQSENGSNARLLCETVMTLPWCSAAPPAQSIKHGAKHSEGLEE